MVVITNDKDIIQEVALIPGAVLQLPEGWHCYFPVSGPIPCVGTSFVPSKETMPWLS